MRVLHLTLKKKWFDMIASGEKKEEYREIKPYWINRFKPVNVLQRSNDGVSFIDKGIRFEKEFDYIDFANGYNHPRKLKANCLGISIGKGNPEWGAEPNKEYFVIKLGELIKQ